MVFRFIVELLSAILIISDIESYHNSIVVCTIIDEYDWSESNMPFCYLNGYKVFTGHDTLILVTKYINYHPQSSDIRILQGKRYRLCLKFVPFIGELADDKYDYIPKNDPEKGRAVASTDLIYSYATFSELYKEQVYIRNHQPLDRPAFIYYTSFQINDKYVPDSLLVE